MIGVCQSLLPTRTVGLRKSRELRERADVVERAIAFVENTANGIQLAPVLARDLTLALFPDDGGLCAALTM